MKQPIDIDYISGTNTVNELTAPSSSNLITSATVNTTTGVITAQITGQTETHDWVMVYWSTTFPASEFDLLTGFDWRWANNNTQLVSAARPTSNTLTFTKGGPNGFANNGSYFIKYYRLTSPESTYETNPNHVWTLLDESYVSEEKAFATLNILPATGASNLLDLNFKTPMKVTIATHTLNGDQVIEATNKLVAVTLELYYDPTKLMITDLAKGDYFSTTFAAPVINPATRKATISLAVSPTAGGKLGSGIVATFNVQPVVAGNATITFGNSTNIQAEGLSINVLRNADRYVFNTGERLASDLVDTADVPGDQVNIQDYTDFVIQFGKSGAAGWIRADINKDGKVDVKDYPTFISQWGL